MSCALAVQCTWSVYQAPPDGFLHFHILIPILAPCVSTQWPSWRLLSPLPQLAPKPEALRLTPVLLALSLPFAPVFWLPELTLWGEILIFCLLLLHLQGIFSQGGKERIADAKSLYINRVYKATASVETTGGKAAVKSMHLHQSLGGIERRCLCKLLQCTLSPFQQSGLPL